MEHPERPPVHPIMVCPKNGCDAPARIEHSVNVPSPMKRGRITFKPDGTPDVPMVHTIKGSCYMGHTFAGPSEDYIEKTVEAFMAQVERWNAGAPAPQGS